MRRNRDPLSKGQHRKIGTDLFNYTWSLLDKKRRTREDNEEMIHAAHASRYHWGHAGATLNRSIGEWQISRVYSVLGRSEPALYHGQLALRLAQKGHLAPFYVAYGHEAMARGYAAGGRRQDQRRSVRQADRAGSAIRAADDRRMLAEDLASLR